MRALRPGLGLEEAGPHCSHTPKEWLKRVWGDLQELRDKNGFPIWDVAKPAIMPLDEISRTGENSNLTSRVGLEHIEKSSAVD